jgi:hypothetical protein
MVVCPPVDAAGVAISPCGAGVVGTIPFFYSVPSPVFLSVGDANKRCKPMCLLSKPA